MFILYLSDMPIRKVKGEEMRKCPLCKNITKHRYEEISFHASVMFVKVYCYKKRYAKICSECNYGQEMTEDEFGKEMRRLNLSIESEKQKTGPDYKLYEVSRQKGIKFCGNCGERIFPDIGYCAACAVRGIPPGTTKCKKCGGLIYPDIGYCTACAVRKPVKSSPKQAVKAALKSTGKKAPGKTPAKKAPAKKTGTSPGKKKNVPPKP